MGLGRTTEAANSLAKLWLFGPKTEQTSILSIDHLSSMEATSSHLSASRPATDRQVPNAFSKLAERPPMGWNSWDCFGVSVTEEEVKANATFIAENLLEYGWKYAVIDLGWYSPTASIENYKEEYLDQLVDPYGRLIPDPRKFPSSADGSGFRTLADFVHSLGLKFGIHIMRGIPWQAVQKDCPILGTSQTATSLAYAKERCPWYSSMLGINMTQPGAQEYYDSLAELYASWHVDFIKADDMNSWNSDGLYSPYRTDEVEAIRSALDSCGRPMVLSLSPGAAELCNVNHLRGNANMFRISYDFWDDWESLKKQFERCAMWAPLSTKGHWPDADMLPLGRIGIRGEIGEPRLTRLTHDEQKTMMTLWCIFRSPLMFGGHLPESDRLALELITNSEVLAVNQNSRNNQQVCCIPEKEVVWTAEVPDSVDRYVALFNLDDIERTTRIDLAVCDMPASCVIRDLWDRADLGVAAGAIRAKLAPHSSKLFRLTPCSEVR